MKTLSRTALRSAEERDQLIEQYLPLVRHVVARLPVTMPQTLDRDDFFSVGVMGLMHAANNYDPTRGASFKTFAYTAIRGAILDEIRKHDPVPRSRRDRLRRTDRARAELTEELRRPPTPDELAAHLDISVDDLEQDQLAQYTTRLLSLNDSSDADDYSLGHVVATPEAGPVDSAIQEELVKDLSRKIGELPETDRHVLILYHFENLYLKEIGGIIGVTESRVSQILTRATERLRLKMKPENPDDRSKE